MLIPLSVLPSTVLPSYTRWGEVYLYTRKLTSSLKMGRGGSRGGPGTFSLSAFLFRTPERIEYSALFSIRAFGSVACSKI